MRFRFEQFLKTYMPRALFFRSLLIIIVPVVLAQIAVAFLFMERHWNIVTQKLSNAVISDVAMLVDLRMRAQGGDGDLLSQLAKDNFNMSLAFLPGENLPPPAAAPTVALLQRSLSERVESQIGRPFWVDTSTYDNYVDIRILLPGEVMRILVQRKQAYATNSHIFLLWMGVASLFLILISVTFLRNQIRPIEQLAEAAESFGRGQNLPDFKPAGASEVRRAAESFIEMRDRIKLQIEQRTTMLAGVSHDLRTPLTRLKLQLAMLPDGDDKRDLSADVAEMEDMLNDYLDFARGYAGQKTENVAFNLFFEQIYNDTLRRWPNITVQFVQNITKTVKIKRQAFARCLTNLINNACAHGTRVELAAYFYADINLIAITVDDNGTGIPKEKLEEVFKPFYRLDDARTDLGGTGLGLAIARDIARNHGGDIQLGKSPLGGLRAVISLPV